MTFNLTDLINQYSLVGIPFILLLLGLVISRFNSTGYY